MARVKDADAADGSVAENGEVAESGDGPTRVTIAQGMRPVYSEIARLSATLGIARQACYTGDPAKAVKALALLGRQLPLALETAELLAPSD